MIKENETRIPYPPREYKIYLNLVFGGRFNGDQLFE